MTEWNGLPVNPERDGWHWLDTIYGQQACYWTAASQCWEHQRWDVADAARLAKYLGPCLTPAEVEALTATLMEEEPRLKNISPYLLTLGFAGLAWIIVVSFAKILETIFQ